MLNDLGDGDQQQLVLDFFAAKYDAELYDTSGRTPDDDIVMARLCNVLAQRALKVLEFGIDTATPVGERAVRELGWAAIKLEGPKYPHVAAKYVDIALDRYGTYLPSDVSNEFARCSLACGIYKERG